ncbi:NAD(P)-dependent alcohol dehydrogenase [Streptosporangium sp. CA-115845]|uniref:NAD(P)-dependent alcohol dehydrogenase n=1 Tax=Streptosporangium sp. CA-115845 TaxID=3240071 RepID=UPI003D9307A8
MRAFRLIKPGEPPAVVEVPTPRPGPGEVLVKVAGVGACHTDITLMDAEAGFTPPLPFTLGHEVSGWVAELGEGVTGLHVGQPVLVYISWGCGRCIRCASGLDHWCFNGANLAGIGRDGGLADYQLVPDARYVVPLPENLDVFEAAPLADAGLTPYHAIRRSAHKLVSPMSTLVVVGVGGLGHLAVQIARATSAATVVAVDISQDKLEFARKLGAHHAILAGPHAAAAVKEMTAGRGADLVVDFVGSDASGAFCAAAAGSMAEITLIGGAGGSITVDHRSLQRDTSVTRSGMGSIPDLHEVVALAASGAIGVEVDKYPFAEVDAVYDRLRNGQVKGRAVITLD